MKSHHPKIILTLPNGSVALAGDSSGTEAYGLSFAEINDRYEIQVKRSFCGEYSELKLIRPTLLACCNWGQFQKIIDTNTYQVIGLLEYESSLATLPDGNIIELTNDNKIKIYKKNSLTDFTTFNFESPSNFTFKNLAVLKNGHIILVGKDESQRNGKCYLYIYDLTKRNPIKTIPLSESTTIVNQITVLPNGLIALVESSNQHGHVEAQLNIWDPNTGNKVCKLDNVENFWELSCTVINDQYLVTGNHDGILKLWDMTTWKCIEEKAFTYTIPDVKPKENKIEKLPIFSCALLSNLPGWPIAVCTERGLQFHTFETLKKLYEQQLIRAESFINAALQTVVLKELNKITANYCTQFGFFKSQEDEKQSHSDSMLQHKNPAKKHN